ncbi:MAG: hypothetical protein ACTHN7_02335 [Solirubrobacterales bacterium]
MKIPATKTILLSLAVLAALVVAGCGGGGGETETTAATTTEEPQPLTKAELIQQGDAICGEVNAAVGALGSEPGEETAIPEQIEKTSNLYIGMVERLQELGTPQGDNGSYAKFMEAAEELAKVEGEVKLAAEREDTAALGEAASEAAPALEEFESQAAIYGFEECSKEPSAPAPSGTGTGEAGGEEAEGAPEEGGVEPEPEFEEAAPEVEEVAPEEAPAPETGGAGGGAEATPEAGGGGGGGTESGGVGPG